MSPERSVVAEAQTSAEKQEDIFWMTKALELAQKAWDEDEVPVGALVVLDGRLLGEGYNQPVGSSDPSAHAEMTALRRAAKTLGNYRLPGTVLYSTIEPCSMCAGAMIHARIERLVYGAAEPRAGAVESTIQVLSNDNLNHRVEIRSGILQAECSEMISRYFKVKREASRGSKC